MVVASFPLLALVLAIVSLNVRETHSFAVRAKLSLVEMRRQSLSRTKKSNVGSNAPPRKHGINHDNDESLSKEFLLDVIDEALYRQMSALEALDRQNQNIKEDSIRTDRIEARRGELADITTKMKNLQSSMQTRNGLLNEQRMEQIKHQICSLGYGSIFIQDRLSWKSMKARDKEFGRPRGFDGQVYYSPLGVPILVGRENAHKDEILRNAANGADLWFQVEDYHGSRVLLRTSLMRGTMGSKQCKQHAANIAAKYSTWGEGYESVPVMYTDSRKVAKRGTKVGSMKKSKSLGRIMGFPHDV